jgi:hypothetical protein
MGCPNPNVYGTPRTTPKGTISHTIALEAMRLQGKTGTAATKEESFTFPTLPTYQLRYGAADRLDLGVSIRNLSTLGVDLKWNFLREKSVDMAIVPGAQAIYLGTSEGSAFLSYIHLPLLLGLNLSDNLSIVLSPGGTVIAGASSDNRSSGQSGLVAGAGFMGRLGLGLNIRTSDKVHLQPEVTVLRSFEKSEVMFFTFGFGINFGSLPKYTGEGDDESGEDPKPSTRTPAAPAPAN